MKLPHRRQFLQLAAGAAALPVVPRIAWAQAYPSRPVRIIVGFAAGGGLDITTRLMGEWLSVRLGQPFIVENRTGANGSIAMEAVARAPRDGYTLLANGSTDSINATLYNKTSAIAPVASIISVAFVMVVNPSLPASTLSDFIAYAKRSSNAINMGSAGTGGPNHLFAELFKALAGINMLHVPYRGGAPAIVDLIAGQIQVLWASIPAVIGYIRAGTLRALAVTTAQRGDAAGHSVDRRASARL